MTAPRTSSSRAIEGSHGRQGIAAERTIRSSARMILFYDTGTESMEEYHEAGYVEDDAEEGDDALEDLEERPF